MAITTISKEEWKEKAENSDNVIIDVRTPEEFNEDALKNAINIDYFAGHFKEEIDKLDKAKTYLIYCRSSARGEKALGLFHEMGFENVYNLEGGIKDY